MKKFNLLLAVFLTGYIAVHAQPNTTPPVVSGTLILDADAVSGFTSGTWSDKSGSGNNLTVNTAASGSYTPTAVTSHGMAAVNFGGNSVMKAYVTSLDTNATVFVVSDNGHYSLNTNAVISMADASTDLNNEFTIEANTVYHHNRPSDWVGKAHQCEAGVDTGRIVVQAGAWRTGYSLSDVDMYLDGSKSTLGLSTYGNAYNYTSVARDINIGSRVQNGVIYHGFTSNIYRILVYNSRLSDSDIDTINNYLMNQYGVIPTGCTDAIKEISSNLSNVSITPNPFSQSSQVVFNADVEGAFIVKMTNLLGEVVSTQPVDVVRGSNKTDIRRDGLSAGVYILSISGAAGSISRKVVIE